MITKILKALIIILFSLALTVLFGYKVEACDMRDIEVYYPPIIKTDLKGI